MSTQPNVVFIFSDQQRYDTLRCYGNDWINVPRLNALADESFAFERAYVAQPVCTPARSTIVTGLYPHAAGPIVNKMVLPPDRKSVAEMSPDAYHTGWFGKWHLGDDVIRQHGFDEWVSTEDGHRPEYTRREYRTQMSDYHQFLIDNGYEPDAQMDDGTMMFSAMLRARLPAEHQMASFLAGRAADFIDRNSGDPFMLYVSTFEPHPPYHGPYDDMYDPESLPVGPTFLQVPEDSSRHNTVRAEYCTQYLGQPDAETDPYLQTNAARGHDVTSEAGWRELRARYFANITLVDEMVGTILDALERNTARWRAITGCWKSARCTKNPPACRCSCASPGCRPSIRWSRAPSDTSISFPPSWTLPARSCRLTCKASPCFPSCAATRLLTATTSSSSGTESAT